MIRYQINPACNERYNLKNEDIITCVSDLLNILKKKKNDSENLFFCRGESKHHEKIIPSIYQKDAYIKYESRMFREYILRNPDEFKDEKSTFEKLVKMQHYSLPTRLLDITSNPLIALYFACEEKKEEEKEKKEGNGRLIIFNVPDKKIKFYDSDTVSVVANIAKYSHDEKLDISKRSLQKDESNTEFRKRFNKYEPIKYLVHDIRDEKPYFQYLVKKEDMESVWCVMPLQKNKRIIRQDGAFLLFGIKGDRLTCPEIKKQTEKQSEDDISIAAEIDIPADKKESILAELGTLGITKDKVYPELDFVAEFLKDKFCKKGANGHNGG